MHFGGLSEVCVTGAAVSFAGGVEQEMLAVLLCIVVDWIKCELLRHLFLYGLYFVSCCHCFNIHSSNNFVEETPRITSVIISPHFQGRNK